VHFGIISPPVPGHLHPFGALGRELIARGHRVTLVHVPDLANRAEAEGLEFAVVGISDFPVGSLATSLRQLATLNGLAALRFTIGEIRKTTEILCRDAATAIQAAKIDVLLVDQTEPAGGAISEYLGLPFVTICNALALNREPDVPPPFTPWNYHSRWWARIRNAAGHAVFDRLMRSITEVVNAHRARWKLPKLHTLSDSFSRLAQISQQISAFDFPRRALPSNFHYVGPIRRPYGKIDFPWEHLDGRPLVYASLGTLQNRKEQLFRYFAVACSQLNLQLVLAHGGGLDEAFIASLPRNTIAVSYAPQLEVLAHAQLTLTHAGLNTVLDSLTFGVPLLAVPIAFEQPAIASRVRWCDVGEVIPYADVTADRLRKIIEQMQANPKYSNNAKSIQRSISEAGGVRRAADLVEKVCRL
jgi:zeaxanthin glucosyltransferase